MTNHPTKLLVVFPIYEARGYRYHLSAIDDALVVHRRGDGQFLFALRGMRSLGPRSYARWLIELAGDLETGHVVVIVNRDDFLDDIERLAREHASAANREAVDRAVAVIADRTRYQIIDHLDGDGSEHRIGRMLIASRKRRIRAERGERDGLNCINGIPTPRSEQLWNSFRDEWCDVRSAQHGRAAWERWARRNRPNMPESF